MTEVPRWVSLQSRARLHACELLGPYATARDLNAYTETLLAKYAERLEQVLGGSVPADWDEGRDLR